MRYRHHPIEFKRALVEQSLLPGVSVSRLAREHGVNANQIFNWRKIYQAGGLGSVQDTTLLPIQVHDAQGPAHGTPVRQPPKVSVRQSSPNDSHIVVEHQGRRVCIEGQPDPSSARPGAGGGAAMIAPPSGTRIWLAAGVTDMRRGMNGLAALVQVQLGREPFSGQLFVFRGRRGDLIKVLWSSGDGLCLFAKRLERGRFIWPQATDGAVHLSAAQLSMLLEGIDWRHPVRTAQPELAA